MNIKIKTPIESDRDRVYEAFDEKLFRFLLPPGASLKRFDGSKKGDIVHLFLPLAGEWISEITGERASEEERLFVDEGRKLPFPLKTWKHNHIVKTSGAGCVIIDDMHYSSGNSILDLLLYPFLLLAFYPRKFQYKKYFKSLGKV